MKGKLYCGLNFKVKRLIERENNDKIDIVNICETERSEFDFNNQFLVQVAKTKFYFC